MKLYITKDWFERESVVVREPGDRYFYEESAVEIDDNLYQQYRTILHQYNVAEERLRSVEREIFEPRAKLDRQEQAEEVKKAHLAREHKRAERNKSRRERYHQKHSNSI